MSARIILFLVNLAEALVPRLVSWIVDYLEERKAKKESSKVDEANLEDYKKAVKEGDADERAKKANDLLNGTRPPGV